jgi:hypothetical protein
LLGGTGTRALVGAGHQSAQRHNFRADLLIEAHNGSACSAEVSEHADAAAKADTLANKASGMKAPHTGCFTELEDGML